MRRPIWIRRLHRWAWWKLFYFAAAHSVRRPPSIREKEARRNIRIGWAGLIDDLILIIGRGYWVSNRRLDVMLEDDPDEI